MSIPAATETNSSMEGIYGMYNHYMSMADPRVINWPLMDTPFKTLLFMVLYILSLRVIKDMMRDRKPFELKGFLVVYNFLQVIGSAYVCIELATVAYLSSYSLTCQPVDYSTDPLPMRMASVLWYYYISKLFDFIDTIVFALRKKYNQITVLHVFHHFTMFPYAWVGLTYVGGGQTFFLCMLNSFVHTVMYAYYGLSALGPHMQKYLWWKKYLTQLQLIQFFAVMFHSAVNAFFVTDCAFPKAFSISYLCYGAIITAFFANFYVQSYRKKGHHHHHRRHHHHTETVSEAEKKAE
jgi:elongation of very long chain fatty acids protein 4